MIAGVSGLRFLTATFVHALSAGLMGYFVSLQIFRKKRGLAWMGLLVAALIHAAYNLSIIGLAAQIDNYKYLVYNLLLIIPLGIGILDLIAFAHLKKIDQDG
jgi:RsiW-degrading membrane proteinase PrsW (M82 family)